jgi:microcystin-dependent protein
MPFWTWSITPGANANADPNIAWPEGMSPSAINDSSRQMMAQLAQYRDDISGLLTTSGTSTTYAVSTNQGLPSPPRTGQRLTAVFNVTNDLNPTLNADGGGGFAIQQSVGVAVPQGTLIAGTPYAMTFLGGAWVLNQIFSYSNLITALPPIGTMMPYAGIVAPNSNWALPGGQQISQTTYATLFALISTSYGPASGGLFTLPDLRGRQCIPVDTLGPLGNANRIGMVGTDSGTINGALLGSHGGSSTHAQTNNELFNHGHGVSGSFSGSGSGSGGGSAADHTHPLPYNSVNVAGPVGGGSVPRTGFGSTDSTLGSGALAVSVSVSVSVSGGISGTAAAVGGGAAMSLLSPALMTGALIRVL